MQDPISHLKKLIRGIPDFPKPGILFRDITPLLSDASGLALAIELLANPFRGKNIDLDLGVLFELEDGYKGCIQALGGNFGAFDHEPFIQLSGDDRTGAVTTGETIRVNGRHFDKIRRIGVFALIYDGAPNWQQTDGIVRITMPGQPEIEVRLDEGRNNTRLCGIADCHGRTAHGRAALHGAAAWREPS